MVEGALAYNPIEFDNKIRGWISTAEKANDDAQAWRAKWEAKLRANAAISQALDDSPDQLFDRAGLSSAERLAMRIWCKPNLDGSSKTTVQIAIEIGAPESTVRSQIQRALEAIRKLRAD